MPRLPDAQRLHVGDIRITVLSDGPLPLGLDHLRGIDEVEYARLLRLHHADPRTWLSGLNVFVIETGDRTILVDAGVGGKTGDQTGRVPDNLKAAGFAPDNIDAIFVTHMHRDHIAGLLDGGAPRFAKATLHVHHTDKNHFAESDLARAVLEAYEHETLTGETDIVHIAPVQLANPEIGTAFDVDVDQARETRKRLLDRVASDATPILGSHITFPGAGVVERASEGYRLAPLTYTHDT